MTTQFFFLRTRTAFRRFGSWPSSPSLDGGGFWTVLRWSERLLHVVSCIDLVRRRSHHRNLFNDGRRCRTSTAAVVWMPSPVAKGRAEPNVNTQDRTIFSCSARV